MAVDWHQVPEHLQLQQSSVWAGRNAARPEDEFIWYADYATAAVKAGARDSECCSAVVFQIG